MDYLVIPAYEPDRKLLALLKKVREKSDFEIIVVDDGSSPACSAIFQEATKWATILSHRQNQGKGAALKTAFAHIKREGSFGVVVTADADGQHKVWDIFRVRNKAQENPKTLVLGSRSFSGKVPLRSAFGNKLTRLLFKQQTGLGIQDTQTGLRAFSSSMLPFMLSISGDRYEYEMNMLLLASKTYPLLEVPIETVYLNKNESSHFRPLRDGLMIYKELFQFALSSFSSCLVDYLIYAVLMVLLAGLPLTSSLLIANTTARTTSSLFNYWTNKKWVFKNQDSLTRTGTAYFSLALLLFGLDTLLLEVFAGGFGLHPLLSKILVGTLLFGLSWLVQKKFIFKERTQALL